MQGGLPHACGIVPHSSPGTLLMPWTADTIGNTARPPACYHNKARCWGHALRHALHRKVGAHLQGVVEVEGRHLKLLLPVLQLPKAVPAHPLTRPTFTAYLEGNLYPPEMRTLSSRSQPAIRQRVSQGLAGRLCRVHPTHAHETDVLQQQGRSGTLGETCTRRLHYEGTHRRTSPVCAATGVTTTATPRVTHAPCARAKSNPTPQGRSVQPQDAATGTT